MVREQYASINTIAFDYGQRHRIELQRSAELAHQMHCEHLQVVIDRRLFRGTALVNQEIEVPGANLDSQEIPVTYVPGRNILFLAHALSYAESCNASAIYLGINALDYSGYPDCRPKFVAAFQEMALLGMKVGVQGQGIQIQAPLIDLTKARIIAEGLQRGVDYSLTSSCYNPGESGQPCLQCDSCILRLKGFALNDQTDPLLDRFGLCMPELD